MAVPRPSVERIIYHHANLQLLQIIAELPRQTDRNRQQTRGLRCKVMAVGICRTHDKRQTVQRLGGQPELGDQRVKRAGLTAMRPKGAVDVKRCGAEPLGHRGDFGRGHKQEAGGWIDEPADQPRAGNTVDLGAMAGHPQIGDRQRRHRHHRQTRLGPGNRTTFQHLAGNPLHPQQRGNPFGKLLAAHAGDHHALAQQSRRGGFKAIMCQMKRSRDQPWISGKIVGHPDIDDRGRIGGADQAHQLGGGDLVWLRHRGPPERGRGCDS